MRKLLFAPLVFLVISCASLQERVGSPEKVVFDATVLYSGALAAAATYNELPRCKENGSPVCSKQEVVDKLRRADAVAKPILENAQQLVRGGLQGSQADQVIAAALAAVKAYQEIVNSEVLGGN